MIYIQSCKAHSLLHPVSVWRNLRSWKWYCSLLFLGRWTGVEYTPTDKVLERRGGGEFRDMPQHASIPSTCVTIEGRGCNTGAGVSWSKNESVSQCIRGMSVIARTTIRVHSKRHSANSYSTGTMLIDDHPCEEDTPPPLQSPIRSVQLPWQSRDPTLGLKNARYVSYLL